LTKYREKCHIHSIHGYYSAGLTVGSVRLVTLSYPEIISPFRVILRLTTLTPNQHQHQNTSQKTPLTHN